jgi:hypothetical protein
MENMMQNVDFSKYKNVFCDSQEALKWAYQNGLPNDAVIRTSSPAMLWDESPSITHIESHWSMDSIKVFQSTIQKFSIEMYRKALMVGKVNHEEALCIALFSIKIQNIIFKAACLEKEDLIEPRLFISVKNKSNRLRNYMNAPWDSLLIDNPKFETVCYNLSDSLNQGLTTKGVSKKVRFFIGGWETAFYRVAIKIFNFLPDGLFQRRVLIPNENELIIESAANLVRHGIRIDKINPKIQHKKGNEVLFFNHIVSSIKPILKKRIDEWVVLEISKKVEKMAIKILKEELTLYDRSFNDWLPVIEKYKSKKSALLLNMPSTVSSLALTKACRRNNIKIFSTQHGVSKEINAVHVENSATYEINSSDLHFTFNYKASKASEKSYFSIGNTFVSGISNRHLRMSKSARIAVDSAPIAYVSTNLYTANFGMINAHLTDYDIAKNERNIINNVLCKLPHKLLYKAYPEENRRYPDSNPVLGEAMRKSNIKVFKNTVDMRYFIQEYRVFITSRATSTLSWLVFSAKPIIFINWCDDNPLTQEAHNSFSKAMFVFNSNERDFYQKLLNFLSRPIGEIELLYEKKKKDRECMIKEYFSEFGGNSGRRISDKIISTVFS